MAAPVALSWMEMTEQCAGEETRSRAASRRQGGMAGQGTTGTGQPGSRPLYFTPSLCKHRSHLGGLYLDVEMFIPSVLFLFHHPLFLVLDPGVINCM